MNTILTLNTLVLLFLAMIWGTKNWGNVTIKFCLLSLAVCNLVMAIKGFGFIIAQ